MSLVTDIDAFYLEHRLCGKLEGDVWDERPNLRVWMTCTCGGLFNRLVLAEPERRSPA